MCGLATIFAYGDGAHPVSEDELLRIRERMVSRGPDGAGVWLSADRRVGLAHRRLSIIELSTAGKGGGSREWLKFVYASRTGAEIGGAA